MRELLQAWRSALACALLGHDQVWTIDTNEGFDVCWCRRCNEVLRG